MLLSTAIQGFFIDVQVKYSPATLPTMRSNLKVFSSFAGDVELDTITPQKLKDFIHHLRTEYVPARLSRSTAPLSESAIDNHWKTQRVFWHWCSETLGIPNPAEKLPRLGVILPVVHPFTEDEVKRMLESCKFSPVINIPGKKTYRLRLPNADRDTAIILILLDTGLRIGEFCRLRNGDISLETGEVFVRPFRNSKKSKPRTVFMGARTRRIVWKYIAARQAIDTLPDNKLFDLTPSSIRHTLKRIGKNAKVMNVHPHKFRHTMAITFLRSGGDVFTLQRLLGHSDLTMVKKYLDLAQADDEAAHRKASPVDNWRL